MIYRVFTGVLTIATNDILSVYKCVNYDNKWYIECVYKCVNYNNKWYMECLQVCYLNYTAMIY